MLLNKQVRFFNPGLGYRKIKSEIDEAIIKVLTNGDLILRHEVEEFEMKLADFCGAKYAVGLNSGTDALYLALKVLGIKPGDEVITSGHTFVATPQVINQLGATPTLHDLDNVWPVSENTACLLPVHIAGDITQDMEELLKYKIPIVEDACQALGAVQNNTPAGTFGVAGCFSFYPAKILGAYGDAGALVTNDESFALEVKELRGHYKKDYSKWGINSRLDNLQAAILNVKIKYLPEILDRRQYVAERYLESLYQVVGLPENKEGRVWQDFIIEVDNREGLFYFLKERDIETMRNEYPMPIPKPPLCKLFEKKSLRIPCNENLTDDEINYVIRNIVEYYGT